MSKISPMTEAELDRIASGIRPSWELDDAPFRPAGFASPELDALLYGNGGGNGAHHIHTNGAAGAIIAQPIVQVAAAVEQEELRTTVDPRPPIELVEAAIAPAPVPAAKPASMPPPAPQPISAPHPAPAAAPALAKNGVVPPAAQSDPFAVPSPWEGKAKAKKKSSTSSAELAAMKKSSSGLWVAIGGGVVAIGIAIYLFSGASSNKTDAVKQEPSAQQLAASAAKAEIPPPPATDEIPTAKATAAPPPPPADTTAMELPATTTTSSPPPTPVPTQPAHVSHNAEPPHHATTSHSNPPPSGGGKKGGGIVHDVPF